MSNLFQQGQALKTDMETNEIRHDVWRIVFIIIIIWCFFCVLTMDNNICALMLATGELVAIYFVASYNGPWLRFPFLLYINNRFLCLKMSMNQFQDL